MEEFLRFYFYFNINLEMRDLDFKNSLSFSATPPSGYNRAKRCLTSLIERSLKHSHVTKQTNVLVIWKVKHFCSILLV